MEEKNTDKQGVLGQGEFKGKSLGRGDSVKTPNGLSIRGNSHEHEGARRQRTLLEKKKRDDLGGVPERAKNYENDFTSREKGGILKLARGEN